MCKLAEAGVIVGFKATSAPDDAIASADNTRFALAETVRWEFIFNAHAITIALSKNNAQSASNKAAPTLALHFSGGFFTKLFLIGRSS